MGFSVEFNNAFEKGTVLYRDTFRLDLTIEVRGSNHFHPFCAIDFTLDETADEGIVGSNFPLNSSFRAYGHMMIRCVNIAFDHSINNQIFFSKNITLNDRICADNGFSVI